MATNLEELENRLRVVEQEVAFLHHCMVGTTDAETPAERGARLLREAEMAQTELSHGWIAAMEEMGVHGSSVGAEELQAMLLASGIKPEENTFSRGIIEMREK